MRLLFMMSGLLPVLAALVLVSNAANIGENRAEADFQLEGENLYDLNLGQPISPVQNNLVKLRQVRSCIGHGENCDHRNGSCCESLTCRCNLWGANCKCTRKGWF